MFTFFDVATREEIPCIFHEMRGGENAIVGVAEFREPTCDSPCYVPVLILGETRDKQFAEVDWRKAKSLEDAKRLVTQDNVSWVSLDSGDAAPLHVPVPPATECFLCGREARIRAVVGEPSERWLVECCGDCPMYEISRPALDTLQDKPHKKLHTMRLLKQVKAKNPTDTPVIRMAWWYPVLRVSTRGSEQQQDL
ncbi:MAG TPA: hypothetical protein VML56_15205 [Burkholderiales bacterium]|nr:hypothetical protein [Burkholderiales bacterium]